MLKNNKAIGAFIIIMALIGLGNSLIKRTGHTCPLLSLMELQEIVGAKVDGKICKSWNIKGHSETGEKWDKYICDQYAEKDMEQYIGEDGYLDFDER